MTGGLLGETQKRGAEWARFELQHKLISPQIKAQMLNGSPKPAVGFAALADGGHVPVVRGQFACRGSWISCRGDAGLLLEGFWSTVPKKILELAIRTGTLQRWFQ